MPYAELETLLLALYSADELRRFLRYGPQGGFVSGALPGGTASPAVLITEAVAILDRNGLIDPAFFDRLLQDRPRRRADIERVREMWLPRHAGVRSTETRIPAKHVLDFNEDGEPVVVQTGDEAATSEPVPANNAGPAQTPDPTRAPKAFISYSWDSPAHKAWVKNLATRLRTNGVTVVLDQWEVALGDQLPEFMETAVRESDFVLLICTPKFKAKADGRKGGVGYEGHVITAEVFYGADPRKFVPVHREGSWDEAAPSWLKGKAYADLRPGPQADGEFERLLEHLHDDREVPPPVGTYVRKNPRPNG